MSKRTVGIAVVLGLLVAAILVYRHGQAKSFSAHNPTIQTEAETTISQQVQQASTDPSVGVVTTTCAAASDTTLTCDVKYGGQQYAYTATVDQSTGQLIAQRQP